MYQVLSVVESLRAHFSCGARRDLALKSGTVYASATAESISTPCCSLLHTVVKYILLVYLSKEQHFVVSRFSNTAIDCSMVTVSSFRCPILVRALTLIDR